MFLSQGTKNLLNDLVKKAYTGEVMLPDFQRNFVWSRQDVEELLKSLLEYMFIGTFLIHHIDPHNPPFKVIPIDGAKKVNSDFTPNPHILILDGQQRLTSIFYALYEPDIPLKNVSNPYRFFINIEKLLKNNIDDSVFSWSIKKKEFNDLLNPDGTYNFDILVEKKLIPISFLKDDFTEIWYKHYNEKFKKEEAQKIRMYIDNIIKYNVLTLDVSLNEKPETIAVLFERINRTGVKLSIFDLLTARLYKFLNLREEWEKSFDNYQNLKKFSGDKKNTIVPYYMIQSLVLALKNSASIKARDMLKLDEQYLNVENWNKATQKLDELLERFLDKNEYGIADVNKWLPYRPMIVVMLALFIRGEQLNWDKINQWYWSSVFTERFSGSTESKLVKDYKELLKWFKNEEEIPEVVEEMRNILFQTFTLDKKYSGNAVYKGVFNLLFINDAKDFFENDKIKFSINELEDHHIFPKKFLEEKNVIEKQDIVANRTLITKTTNLKISKKAPAVYLKEMIKVHGNDVDKVKQLLNQHFIDENMFEILMNTTENSTSEEVKSNFEKFIKMREEKIKIEISKLIGL